MAGHNKWSQIKHKKAKTDKQRGKLFSKVTREIIIAVKIAGTDPGMNARLRLAIQKAKEINMPNDNIKRAIERGAGNSSDANMEEVLFEAYGQNGVAILIETVTDNKNRTVPNLRTILSKKGGNLASKGAVSYLFEKKGLFIFEPNSPEDEIMDIATHGNALDVNLLDDGSIEVITLPEDYEALLSSFDQENIAIADSNLTLLASSTVRVDDAQKARKLLQLIEALEDDDDVQNVHGNFDIPDEVYDEVSQL